ncbi:NPCBM/NEW2 domain-containing protein (plasmid) [Leisingera sp. M527]|uniref:NPCBM/NEW2 domain-containing protein n=1 Tax=Leisingera sp. M527 TaxID=2867014 RepID=UPI0021A4EE8A|nr:NPCBM/NEW2 domain-containing protein [Leisingera sp. M527]UWQ35671.1 NPCBM/NEW2 domain-containing protein [Leisingera sp. M527]
MTTTEDLLYAESGDENVLAAEYDHIADVMAEVLADLNLAVSEDAAGLREVLRASFSKLSGDQSAEDALFNKFSNIDDDLMPEGLAILPEHSLNGAHAAYSANAGGTIVLTYDAITQGRAYLKYLLAEELGHHFDALLGEGDSSGDEGAKFAAALYPDIAEAFEIDTAAEAADEDAGVFEMGGEGFDIEFAGAEGTSSGALDKNKSKSLADGLNDFRAKLTPRDKFTGLLTRAASQDAAGLLGVNQRDDSKVDVVKFDYQTLAELRKPESSKTAFFKSATPFVQSGTTGTSVDPDARPSLKTSFLGAAKRLKESASSSGSLVKKRVNAVKTRIVEARAGTSGETPLLEDTDGDIEDLAGLKSRIAQFNSSEARTKPFDYFFEHVVKPNRDPALGELTDTQKLEILKDIPTSMADDIGTTSFAFQSERSHGIGAKGTVGAGFKAGASLDSNTTAVFTIKAKDGVYSVDLVIASGRSFKIRGDYGAGVDVAYTQPTLDVKLINYQKTATWSSENLNLTAVQYLIEQLYTGELEAIDFQNYTREIKKKGEVAAGLSSGVAGSTGDAAAADGTSSGSITVSTPGNKEVTKVDIDKLLLNDPAAVAKRKSNTSGGINLGWTPISGGAGLRAEGARPDNVSGSAAQSYATAEARLGQAKIAEKGQFTIPFSLHKNTLTGLGREILGFKNGLQKLFGRDVFNEWRAQARQLSSAAGEAFGNDKSKNFVVDFKIRDDAAEALYKKHIVRDSAGKQVGFDNTGFQKDVQKILKDPTKSKNANQLTFDVSVQSGFTDKAVVSGGFVVKAGGSAGYTIGHTLEIQKNLTFYKAPQSQAGTSRRRAGSAEDQTYLLGDDGSDLERLLNWEAVAGEVSAGFTRMVDSKAPAGQFTTEVRHAPQSLYVGVGKDGKPCGQCVGLSLGYLYSLSQSDSTKQKFLDGVFTHSRIVDNSSSSVREDVESVGFQSLIRRLSAFGNSGDAAQSVLNGQGSLTLDQVMSRLQAASGDAFYELHTGNHAFAVAKKVSGGTASYHFYETNAAEVKLSSSSEAGTAGALKSVIESHLQQKSSGGHWEGSLASYYDTKKNSSGSLVFDTYQFDPAKVSGKEAFTALDGLLEGDGFVTERQRLSKLGDISLNGKPVSALALYDAATSVHGLKVSGNVFNTLVSGGAMLSDLRFDVRGLEGVLSSDLADAEKVKLAVILKQRLEAEGGDLTKVFSSDSLQDSKVGTTDLAQSLADVVTSKITGAYEAAPDFHQAIETATGQSRNLRKSQELQAKFGLTVEDTASVLRVAELSKQLNGYSEQDFQALRNKHRGASDLQLLEIAATDQLRRSVRGLDDGTAIVDMADWTRSDAMGYLNDQGVFRAGPYADPLDVNAVRKIVNSGTYRDRLELVSALTKIDPELYRGIETKLRQDTDLETQKLGQSLRRNFSPSRAQKALNGANISFTTLTTLNSVRSVITDWNNLNTTQKALTVTELAGGVALPTVVSKGISTGFKLAGKALGTVGKAVKAGGLDLLLAPISLASIGLEWKDFWNNNGDQGSIEYKSLVSSTVITTVSLAASVALTGVSIAAAVSASAAGTTVAAAAAAGSLLATVASSAGPIGLAIGAAAFIIQGIVQGALQIEEYGDYFENTADKVHQFFAAWVGVETRGFKEAKAKKQGEEAAADTETSLLDGWNETKAYLSDIFAKSGNKDLNVRNRSFNVNYGIVDYDGDNDGDKDEVGYLLQQEDPVFGNLERITTHLIATGTTVWAELGRKAGESIIGDLAKKNLFSLDNSTELTRLTGGDLADVYNMSSEAKVGHLDGGAGVDTLILDADGHSATIDLKAGTGRITHPDPINFNLSSIENISVVNAHSFTKVYGDDGDNLLDVRGDGFFASGYEVHGGGGANTIVVNSGIVIHSTSDDTFLWSAGSHGQIWLDKNDGPQAALIELPDNYDRYTLDTSANALVLRGPDGKTLQIGDIFEGDGTVRKNKILQFRDKSGASFSLTLENKYRGDGSNVYPVSLERVSKSFVFKKKAAGDNDITRLAGDQAVSTYRLNEGAGAFLLEPRTQRMMSVVLNVDFNKVDYFYTEDGQLTLLYFAFDDTIEVLIPDYHAHAGQITIYANKPGTENAVPALLELPLEGRGRLSAENLAGGTAEAEEAVSGLRSTTSVKAGDAVELSSADAQGRYVAQADAAAGLAVSIASLSQIAYLRMGDDLLVYDESRLDPALGLEAQESLLIEGYYAAASAPGLTVNGQSVTAQAIAAETDSYLGSSGDDELSGANYIEMAGGAGSDTYIVDLSGSKSFVIDNTDGALTYDMLQLDGVASGDMRDVVLTHQGGDLILSYQNSQVTLKNFNRETEARHLRVRLGVSGFNYGLPALVSGETNFYELDARNHQRIQLIDNGKPHFFDLPQQPHFAFGSNQGYGYVELDTDVAAYTKEVIGLDLKLTSADGSQSLYFKNYYLEPDLISFAWRSSATATHGDTYNHDVQLPDGDPQFQAYLDAGIARKDVVHYVNAGLTAAEAQSVEAFNVEDTLVEAPRTASGRQQLADREFAFVSQEDKSQFDTKVTIFDQTSWGSKPGIRIEVNREGDLELHLREWSGHIRQFQTAAGSAHLKSFDAGQILVALDPVTRRLRIAHDTEGMLFQTELPSIAMEAFRSGLQHSSPEEFDPDFDGKLYFGDNAYELAGDRWPSGAGFEYLDQSLTAAEAKVLLRGQRLQGDVSNLINQLVDDFGFLDKPAVSNAIAYLKAGLHDAEIIKLFSDELLKDASSGVRDKIRPEEFDLAFVTQLRGIGANAEFVLAAIDGGLNAIQGEQYLSEGVLPQDVKTVRDLISGTATSQDAVLIEKALFIAGYQRSAAKEVAAVMAEKGLSDHARIDAYFRIGITSADAIKRFIDAGVSAADIVSGDEKFASYEAGDRGGLIQVSVSDSLSTFSTVRSYWANRDLDGGKIKSGEILESAAASSLAVPHSSSSDIGVSEVDSTSWGSRSNPSNIVDGWQLNRDATAWATGEDDVALNGNAWIKFDLADKIILTSLTIDSDLSSRAYAEDEQAGADTAIELLRSQNAADPKSQFKIQALDNAGNWQDVSDVYDWEPAGNSSDTVQIRTGGIPYKSYRLVGVSGTFSKARWIKEITFTTTGITESVPNALGEENVYLSDLAFSSQSNGWGAAERDRSNGEAGSADGKQITIGGATYAKGLGVHAGSEIMVDIPKGARRFISDIGVDDEVGAGGSVTFKVYGDNQLLFESGTLTGSDGAGKVDVSVAGYSQLRLVVDDAGDGNGGDHADWAGARFVRPAEAPLPQAQIHTVSDRQKTAFDYFNGSFANQRIGGAGEDYFVGTDADEFLSGGDTRDFLYGKSGDDLIHGGAGLDHLEGGDGFDTASYKGASWAIRFDLNGDQTEQYFASGVWNNGDSVSGFEGVIGSGLNDVLIGNSGANFLQGGNGEDTITGGAGDDLINGGSFVDDLNGGSGYDIASYYDANHAVWIELGSNQFARYQAGDGNWYEEDKLTNFEGSIGSSHGDQFYGNAASNYLDGQGGNDLLRGRQGDDDLRGGQGDDSYIYSAGDGHDVISDTGGTDRIIYEDLNGQSIGISNLWFTRDGEDLYILNSEGGSEADGSQRINGYFSEDGAGKIEELATGGKSLSSANIDLLVSQMAGHARFDYGAATQSGATIQEEITRLWVTPAV